MISSPTMTFSVGSDSSASGRPLSSRRGSLSAPDPLAQNASVDTPRGSTSRLTIIRVPPSPQCSSPSAGGSVREDVITLEKPRMRPHSTASLSNIGRAAGWGHPRSGADNGEGRKERVSFASSSFSPTGKPISIEGGSASNSTSSSSSSPSHSPIGTFTAKNRTRSNPSLPTRGLSAFQTRRASLSPEQVCDLARTSLKLATSDGILDSGGPRSPYSDPLSPPPHDTPNRSLYSPHSPDLPPGSPTPFTPLPESHYLPFIDRPSEVGELLSSDANRRLMALLKQTFPPHLRDTKGNPDEQDPTDWSFLCLASFLTECPRLESPDTIWVSKARRCIRARSEVVWERLKDVLGVPPELDVDESFEDEEAAGRQSPEAEEEDEEAWVEPIFPSTSPLSVGSPGVTTVSPIDIGGGGFGFGFGGRGNGMETIGEGEEEDNVPTVTNTRASSLEDHNAASTDHPEPPGPIRALRLCTRLSFSEDRSTPPDTASAVPPHEGTGIKPLERSSSHGQGHRPSLQFTHGLDRSFSQGHVRRPSTRRPEFERGPGNPLFPSNFGRLSVGPTLAANNPTLRQQFAPLPSAYPAPSSRRYTYTGNATDSSAPLLEDRLHPTASTGSDYAITFASGSDRSS